MVLGRVSGSKFWPPQGVGSWPSWLGRPVFLAVAAIATFGASWAGTQTSLFKHQVEQSEFAQLETVLGQLNQAQSAPRWQSVRNGRWLPLANAVDDSATAAQAGVVDFAQLSRDPKAAMPLLKRLETRWLQIDIGRQQLTAWEGDRPVRTVDASTGKSATPTRPGVWAIYIKLRSTRMRGPGYDVPNVPYTMYYDGGYGIHGAYWHNNFGTPMSHGCTNLSVGQARWFYGWASEGTPVVAHR